MRDKIREDTDKRKTPDENTHQGNNLSLLFLVCPAIFLIWAFRTGIILPINQVDFFIQSATYSVLSFILLWMLAFHRADKDRTLYAVSAFLLILWCIGGLVGISKINTTWDGSAEKIYYTKAIEVKAISGSGGRTPGRPSCMVRIENKLFGVDVIWVKYRECDDIRAGADGLQIKVKDGRLYMPWITEHSIVKDYDLYKSRLGISD